MKLVMTMFGALAASSSALVACGSGSGGAALASVEGGAAQSGAGDGGASSAAPEGGGVTSDTGAPDSGVDPCSATSPAGPPRSLPKASDTRAAKAIYDEFFGQYLPQYAEFGWTDAPLVTAAWVESLHFPTPPAGLGDELLHNLFDFNPHNLKRPGLAGLGATGQNAALFSATSDPLERLRRYDPSEWMPAVATTYSRTATSDVMADQFWYRARTPELRPMLEKALALCPDCDDAFTPLSHDDLYKVIEIEFVRFGGSGVQTSRPFKLIGVDSSGAIGAHTQNDSWNNFGTIGGTHVTAKWRMELSGLIAQRYWQSDTAYVQLMPVLVRASRTAALLQYYDGRFDRDAGAPGDPYARAYNTAADGQCIRDCHTELCQAGRNVSGYYYAHQADCTCVLSATPFATPLASTTYATGACESWTSGGYGTTPSTGACTGP